MITYLPHRRKAFQTNPGGGSTLKNGLLWYIGFNSASPFPDLHNDSGDWVWNKTLDIVTTPTGNGIDVRSDDYGKVYSPVGALPFDYTDDYTLIYFTSVADWDFMYASGTKSATTDFRMDSQFVEMGHNAYSPSHAHYAEGTGFHMAIGEWNAATKTQTFLADNTSEKSTARATADFDLSNISIEINPGVTSGLTPNVVDFVACYNRLLTTAEKTAWWNGGDGLAYSEL